MKPVSEIDAIRQQAILSSLAGFPFLLVFAFVWITAGSLSYLYRTRLYGLLGVVVAVGPFVLAVLFGERAMHYTGFFVGGALLVGAFTARSHARATWLESGHH